MVKCRNSLKMLLAARISHIACMCFCVILFPLFKIITQNVSYFSNNHRIKFGAKKTIPRDLLFSKYFIIGVENIFIKFDVNNSACCQWQLCSKEPVLDT